MEQAGASGSYPSQSPVPGQSKADRVSSLISVTFQLSDLRQVAAPPRVPSKTQDWDKKTVFIPGAVTRI